MKPQILTLNQNNIIEKFKRNTFFSKMSISLCHNLTLLSLLIENKISIQIEE